MPVQNAAPEGEALIQLAYLAWLESLEILRGDLYSEFRDYYEGIQLTQLTARMRKFLELTESQDFRINVCPIVVDALAEKLKVAKFTCEGQDDIYADWWRKSRMDALQSVVHVATIRDGDTYVLVEWDNLKQRPSFYQENAYNGVEGTHIVYSDERRSTPVVGVKRWTIQTGEKTLTRRTNLYYDDRIEKYTDLGSGKDWSQFVEEEGDFAGQWPIPWTKKDGSPIGIPIIHFRNRDLGYSYGISELNDVVVLQNAGNKALIDLLAAADTTGFQMTWATGLSPTDSVVVAPGILLKSTNPDVKFGVIPAAPLNGLQSLKDSIIADIAKITRTPLSYFQLTGQVAAAGTLKEQRSGLVSKALDRQVVFGNAWEDVMHVGRKLNNTFGTTQMDEEVEIQTLWVDDEKPELNELATSVELLNRAAAASADTKVRLLHPDWEDDKVTEEVEAIRAETGTAVPDIGTLATDEMIASGDIGTV